MNYKTLYDVRDDSLFAGHAEGLFFLGFSVLWTLFWFLLHRFVRGMPEERRQNSWKGLVVGGILIAVGVIIVSTTTVPAIRNQLRCRDWLQAGEYETSTGEVTNLRRDAGKYSARRFRIGETDFAYWGIHSPIAGFRGDFTAAGASEMKLRDGMPLRIAHREGRILQIDVAER